MIFAQFSSDCYMFIQCRSFRQHLACLTLALILLLCAGIGTAQAQQPAQPLTLEISGDYWTWSGAQSQLIRRTNWGYNLEPILSPDGKLVAYKSTAALVVNAIKRNGPSIGGDMPANIWVIDITNGNSQQIGKQPPGASFQVDGVRNKYVIRSNPTC